MPEWGGGERVTAEKLSRRGIRMRGRRTTATGTFTTTETGILRLDDCPILNGRSYRIKVNTLQVRGSVALDGILSSVRYTTDGSTPTTSSPVLPGAQNYFRVPTSSSGFTVQIETGYEPGADQTLSLLLSAVRGTGTGNVDIYADASAVIEMSIEDVGIAVGNTGTVI